MKKVLVIDPDKCTGCRICEQVCSVWHEKVVNPYRARIKVVKWEMEGKVIPMVCQQCDDAPCIEVCPMSAIYNDDVTGAVQIDYDRCIGCGMCISTCPFGAMGYDFVGHKVIKCDLCNGDPQCVRFCDAGAIRLESKAAVNAEARTRAARQALDAVAR